jgi:hypothetical protein
MGAIVVLLGAAIAVAADSGGNIWDHGPNPTGPPAPKEERGELLVKWRVGVLVYTVGVVVAGFGIGLLLTSRARQD